MNTSISVLLERKGSSIFSVPSTITAAAAGLGKPLKYKWSSSSLVSTLKRAKRNAAQAA